VGGPIFWGTKKPIEEKERSAEKFAKRRSTPTPGGADGLLLKGSGSGSRNIQERKQKEKVLGGGLRKEKKRVQDPHRRKARREETTTLNLINPR